MVVVGDGLRVGQVIEVLAEVGDQDADACRLERFRGGQRFLHRLARHETPDGPARERQAR